MNTKVLKKAPSDDSAQKTKYFRSPLKWPGGKFRDLGHLMPLFPKAMDRYIDPFVGSGTVAANVAIEKRSSRMVLGDIDSDLIRFMQMDQPTFERFQSLLIGLEAARHDAALAGISEKNFPVLFMATCVRSLRHIDYGLRRNDVVKVVVEKERARRIAAMKKMAEDGNVPDANYPRTAIFAVIYYLVRDAYNAIVEKDRARYFNARNAPEEGEASPNTATGAGGQEEETDPAVRIATWFVLRELAHGGVMRYSRESKFNTAYGGMSYNTKSLLWKLPDITFMSELFAKNKAQTYFSDFLRLLNSADPGENDFVFLDPPYEQTFHGSAAEEQDVPSTPDQSFYPYVRSKDPVSSHSDLFRWLQANGHKTRWMLVERQTPWIMDKINALSATDPRIAVQTYDRKYAANIKGRNNRSTTHVIVTNYPAP